MSSLFSMEGEGHAGHVWSCFFLFFPLPVLFPGQLKLESYKKKEFFYKDLEVHDFSSYCKF